MGRPVTIHSEGTGKDTVIVNEDGLKLDNVRAATVQIEAGCINEVTLEIIGSPVKIDGTVTSSAFTCQLCDTTVDHECDSVVGGGQPINTPVTPPIISGHYRLDDPNERIPLASGSGVNSVVRIFKLIEAVSDQNGKVIVTLQDEESFNKERRRA